MKRLAKILSMIITVSLLAGLFAACGNSQSKSDSSTAASATSTDLTDSTANASGSEKLDQVELTIFTGGDQVDQPGFPKVSDEIAKVTADNINVKIDVQTYAWGDYKTKVDTSLAAGQNIDIYLDFSGEFKKDADKKQIIPLDDLIEKYGADLKKQIPQDIWNDVKYNGYTYGVPAVYPFVGQDTLMIRGDLREKYGIPEIKDVDTLNQYLDAIAKNEKGIVGFSAREGRGGCPAAPFINKETSQNNIKIVNNDFGDIVSVDYTKKPYKAESVFESDSTKKAIEWNKQAYANGWMAKDVLTQKDPQTLFTSGKSSLYSLDMWTVNSVAPTMEKNIPGCKVETVPIYDYDNLVRTRKCNNFAVISSVSKNPERAMMFLNWIRASQDNYNLLMYGIKGQDWVPVDDKNYDLAPGVDPTKRAYNPTPWWFKNQNMDLNLKGTNEQFLKIYNKVLNAKYITPKIIDFSFDSRPVKTQMAQVQTVMLEKWNPVFLGINTSESDFKAAIDALNKAGLQDIIKEAQKQLDEWAAVNDK